MDYKSTLNLPKTDFSMQARLVELEPKMLKQWADLDLYALVRKVTAGRPKYILHDGPPYANGDIHIGHALNKILKDVVVKYKTMQGFSVPFVPGWDCHGLPVEHQLFKELGLTKHQIDKVEFRKKAKAFAWKFVQIQKKQFQRLGVIGDWQRPYLTMDFGYEAEIIRAFAKLAKDGYVYRGLKPINWCINCETALAEAEVEYEDHRSPSIYVKFRLLEAKKKMQSLLPDAGGRMADNIYLVIWTTTPWTLVSNVAVAVHPKLAYSFLNAQLQDQSRQTFIIASDLVEAVMRQIGITDYQKIAEVKGALLENLFAQHPFLERTSRVVLADYVSNQEGTGCVHTAPGHGQEDYLTGLKYKLPVIMPVDAQGRFDRTCAEFSGAQVFAANALVIDKLRKNNSLLLASELLHTYPYCWRCKGPLITRSTRQWFINVEHHKLRRKAQKAVSAVQWIPPAGAGRILSMLATRPDWCLSRQRFWGVPIPVFYCNGCHKEIVHPDIIERFAQEVLQKGCDVWFTESVDKLLGQKLRCPVCRQQEFTKEEDIIDVWFDSGVSHQAVLARNKELGFPAALYLEGSDQHRGWFQTALLTAIPLKGKAPYRKVLTHGFVVDGEGKKMSKSRGNVISPQEVIERYGAEVLRLWVASCDYSDDVRISPQILASIADAYRKIRNTLRFLLGNLYDFSPGKKVPYHRMDELDRWALSALTGLVGEVTADFEHFHYYKVFRRLYNFCVHQMSAFYLDILKDRLYTFQQDSVERRSAQTVICEIATTLTRMLAPILTFTAFEVWPYLARILELRDSDPVILQPWPKLKRGWIDARLTEKMERIIKIRDAVLKAVETQRENGLIHSSLEAKIILYPQEGGLFQFLQSNLVGLVSIFIVSDISLQRVASSSEEVSTSRDIPQLGIKVERIDFPKCQRCWNYRSSVGRDGQYPALCQRCVGVLEKEIC